MTWSGTDINDIEQNFNARLTVPEYADHVARCRAATDAVKSRLHPETDLRYGPHELESLDWYRSGRSNAPVHVFIHGGFWRANDKKDFGLIAAPVSDAGADAVVINYPLCPEVSLDQVVQSVNSAIKWIWNRAADFRADMTDFTLSGHSAGAHLAAMVLAHDWVSEGLPPKPIRSAVLISGIYELQPVLQISVNREKIHLTPDRVPFLSPMRRPPSGVSLLLPVGGDEAPLWMRQSSDLAAAVRDNGGYARYIEIPGRNHCNLMETFEDSASPLTRMTLDHLFRS